MTLVVEDGTGKADANSYATKAECDTYHEAHLYADAWTGAADDATREKALMMATRLIDLNVEFRGWRTSQLQALEWPRIYVQNFDDYWSGGLVSLAYPYAGGMYYLPNAIPGRLKSAVCEMARELLKADRSADSDQKGITRVGLGQGAIDVTFNPSKDDRPAIFTDLVATILQPFGTVRYKRSRARVRRV